MPRPRRPLLAAICASLLLITGTLWLTSYWRMITCRWALADNSHGLSAARQTTWDAMCYNGGVIAFREKRTCFFAFAHPLNIRISDNVMPPGYPYVDGDIPGANSVLKSLGFQLWTNQWTEQYSGDQCAQVDVVLPLWFPVLMASAAMVWFWRGRPTEGPAFPVVAHASAAPPNN